MTAKRSFFLVVVVLVVCAVCLPLILPTKRRAGSLSVSFVGLTNDASGNRLAQFSVANHFPRRVSFGVCEVQLCQTNAWPGWMRDAGAGAWLALAAGREHAFSVPIPQVEGAKWRVPIMYREDLSFIDGIRFRIDLFAWGIARWRPGKPVPVRNGVSFHRSLFTYGPEMLGMSNPQGGANGRQPFSSEANSTLGPAASRRSP
jgi:hypothetical protein